MMKFGVALDLFAYIVIVATVMLLGPILKPAMAQRDKPRSSRRHEDTLPNHPTTQLPNSPSSDESEFDREMSDVIPLRRDPRGRIRATPPTAPRPAPASTRARGHVTDESDYVPDFVAPGVDRREDQKTEAG